MQEIGFDHECLHFGDTENVKIKTDSHSYGIFNIYAHV